MQISDMLKLKRYWQSEEYTVRVRELEAKGLTTSDAQAVADVEFWRLHGYAKQV